MTLCLNIHDIGNRTVVVVNGHVTRLCSIIAYAVDHIGTARDGLRNLYDIDFIPTNNDLLGSHPRDRQRTMGMLQTSWRTAGGTRRFNVPHTTILWLRNHLLGIGTAWNHPRSGLPPGNMPSKDWLIRLEHLWDPFRPSTRTFAERPGRLNPEYPFRPWLIISGDLHCVPDDRIEAPS